MFKVWPQGAKVRVEMGCKAQTADCFCDPAEICNAAQRLETVSMSALAAATGRLWTAFQTRTAPSLNVIEKWIASQKTP